MKTVQLPLPQKYVAAMFRYVWDTGHQPEEPSSPAS